jgi:hypothetical protein
VCLDLYGGPATDRQRTCCVTRTGSFCDDLANIYAICHWEGQRKNTVAPFLPQRVLDLLRNTAPRERMSSAET